MAEKRSSYEEMAGQILEYVRDRLVIFLPYFNRALLGMPWEADYSEREEPGGRRDSAPGAGGGGAGPVPGSGRGTDTAPGAGDGGAGPVLGTDGSRIFADAAGVVRLFRTEPERLPRAYIHLIFHCVYAHPFRMESFDKALWDFACDLAAESAALLLDAEAVGLPDDGQRRDVLDEIILLAGDISAERIYHFLETHPRECARFHRRRELFLMDDHSRWTSGNETAVREIFISRAAAEEFQEKVRRWAKIQQTARVESLSYRISRGDVAGRRVDRFTGITRDDYDYSEFLKRFAAETEEVRLNPEEFDYIYYTYGLSLYENMPLIEPLEYREAKKICDLVIAIDTSGSCQGQTVRTFLEKTYSLLKNSDVFTERMNLRIIQCDCEIQSEAAITSDEEFERYMSDIEVSGAGGTDFRPVFDRIDALLREGAFHNFRGLLYFTDGLGRFPERKPAFRTAFVFVGRQAETPHLPAWAEHYTLRE